jgi:hypothetical protein
MSYAKSYNQAIKENKVKKESIELFSFSLETPQVIGMYMSSEERESEEYKGTYYVHTFDTDYGPISIAPGTLVDKVLLQEDMKGKVFAITFLGKEVSKKGKPFNNFRVESFNYAEK